MGAQSGSRRLAAILAADVVGYSRMVAAGEAGTRARLRGICISGRVREDASAKIALEVEDLGEPELKNVGPRPNIDAW